MSQTPAPSSTPKAADGSDHPPPTPGVIAGHSALEFLLTLVLLFGVTTIVRWVMGPSSLSDRVPRIHLQLLIVGVAVGVLIAALILSYFLQASRLAPLVPWLVGVLIGGAIAVLGTTTGGSVNPARQFGPAVASGKLSYLWVYLLAPMVGALVAAFVLDRVGKHRAALTYRLCGTQESGAPLPGPPQEDTLP
ncbi:aquaporin [Streptomyces sp. NPDC052051]|uniref:aquaporin n=1 Tax=Streptomyces sp. NPDC052051 TaxID=3154649 RepID=UPI0034465228